MVHTNNIINTLTNFLQNSREAQHLYLSPRKNDKDNHILQLYLAAQTRTKCLPKLSF